MDLEEHFRETQRAILRLEQETARMHAWQRVHWRWFWTATVLLLVWIIATAALGKWLPWIGWLGGIWGWMMGWSRAYEHRCRKRTGENPPVPPEWPWRRGAWVRREETERALHALEEV